VTETINATGEYSRAKQTPAHPGRRGAAITPCALVIHTTDMVEDSFSGLVDRTMHEAGNGAGYHWLIGRTPAQGVLQMTSAFRNGNHAGGSRNVGTAYAPRWIPFHGNFKLANGQLVHPNTWALGIEVHNAGYLGHRGPHGYVHQDSGRIIADADVHVDQYGIGWQRVTQYQLDELALLTAAVRAILAPMPAGVTIAPNGTYAANRAQWAVTRTAQIVGHATLDPLNKNDPGPVLIDWINALQ
jgi:hypothetical protein